MTILPKYRRPEFVQAAVLQIHQRFHETPPKRLATQAMLLEEAHSELKWRHQAVIQLIFRCTQHAWFAHHHPLVALSPFLQDQVDYGVICRGAAVYFASLEVSDQDRLYKEFFHRYVGGRLSGCFAFRFLKAKVPNFGTRHRTWLREFNNQSRAGVEFLDTNAVTVLVGGIPDLHFLLDGSKPKQTALPPAPYIAPVFQASDANPLLHVIRSFHGNAKLMNTHTQFEMLEELAGDPSGCAEAIELLSEMGQDFSAFARLLTRLQEKKIQ